LFSFLKPFFSTLKAISLFVARSKWKENPRVICLLTNSMWKLLSNRLSIKHMI
jgi:hypothetical protein